MSNAPALPMEFLTGILGVLDDMEQEYSDLYEETGDIGYLLLRMDATALYHDYDAMRFTHAST